MADLTTFPHLADTKALRRLIGDLVNKFRVVLPDLYCYMDEEDVSLVASNWNGLTC